MTLIAHYADLVKSLVLEFVHTDVQVVDMAAAVQALRYDGCLAGVGERR